MKSNRSSILSLRTLTFFALGPYLLLIGLSQIRAQEDPRIKNDARVNNWEEDIAFLSEELPQRHKDLFFKLTKKQFLNSINEIRTKILQSTDVELQLELARLVTSVGDGHTRINIDHQDFDFFPIQFRQFKDGLFVTAATADFQSLVGGKLIAIDEKSPKEIYQRMETIIAHDNGSYLREVVPYYMQRASMLEFVGIGITGMPSNIKVVKDEKELMLEVPKFKLEPINKMDWISAKKEYALYEEQESKNFWTKWLPEEKTMYLKYRRCSGFLAFGSLAAKTVKFLNENDVDRLVVDMRLNGGGNSAIMQPFLIAIRPGAMNSKGRLYVVTGRKTFSSAVLNSIDFKQKTKAILVGEPTGGRPNHFGEVKNMSLPNSGLRVTYSTNYFEHFKGGDPESLEPDVAIEPTFSQWCNGKDAVMEYILSQPIGKQ